MVFSNSSASGAVTYPFLAGGSECARLIAERDWSGTPLGPIDAWDPCLSAVTAMILRSSVPMVLMWGRESVKLYNDAYAALAGDNHPGLLGMTVRENWPACADFSEQVTAAVLDGEALHFHDQEMTICRNGRLERVWMDLDYSPVPGPDGAPRGVLGIVSETSERVASGRRTAFLLSLADALRPLTTREMITTLASERLAEWMDATRVFYAEITDDGWMTVERDLCRGVPSIAGIHSLDAFGKDLLQAYRSGQPIVACDIPADERLSVEARAGLAERRVAAFVDVVIFDATEWVGVLAVQSATPRVWTDTEIALVQEVAERVKSAVERARAEEGLHRLNETLEEQVAARSAERDRLWNLSPDMFARADYAGTMSAVSPAWTQVLGWSAAELTSRPYEGFIHSDDVQPTAAAIAIMAETLQPARFENRIATRDGGWKPIEWTVSPEEDGVNFVAVGRDLTNAKAREADLESAREALRQSQKMEAMGSLTGGVAHDFNNLLTPIVGSLDMLMRKGIGTDRERRLIEGALQSAERARTLVQRLLAFARRQPLKATAVDVARVVEGMVGLLGSTLGPTIEIAIAAPADLPPAKADLNQLEMALLNLAVNARDAMPDGGRLTIAATRESVRGSAAGLERGQYVKLSVGDTGVGMDEETKRRAIEPFFSTKGIGKGTGLGLSMVHGLTAQLGGGLTIESIPAGGTTISLWLPVSDAAVSEQVGPAAPATPAGALGTALLIDDEDLVRMSTAEMLADLDYAVVEAASAEEGLRLLSAGLEPDILVTDHLMPGISGAQLARELKSSRPHLPVLIVSGYAEEAGIDADIPRLTKPFRNAELAASLASLKALSKAS